MSIAKLILLKKVVSKLTSIINMEMKIRQIIDVDFVTNYLLMQQTLKYTIIQSMKATKIINVNLVVNHFLMHKI